MPNQSWIYLSCLLSIAQGSITASAAESFLCLTPQITEYDETKTVELSKFLNTGGKLVIDKGNADPLKPLTLRDFQLAFGDDSWKQSDSLPGGNGKIRIGVSFLDGTPFQIEAVKKYASEWLVSTGAEKIQFAFGDSSKKHIRITFDVAPNFNQSLIGRQATLVADPSSPTMHLGDVREDVPADRMKSVIRHEFGHALGMRHEHQHPDGGIKWDKSAIIAELASYGWSATKVQRNIFDVFARSYACRGAPSFDPKSIMMYPIKASWTLDGYEVASNIEIVPADLQCVHSLYE